MDAQLVKYASATFSILMAFSPIYSVLVCFKNLSKAEPEL